MSSKSSQKNCSKKRCADANKPYQQSSCRCSSKVNAYTICKENLQDISDCIVKILIIFGMEEEMAGCAKKIIFLLFHHYDYVRLSYNEEKPASISKKNVCDLLSDINHMTGIEAELTYFCIKRAFKAYFHNKCLNGLNNPILDAKTTAQDTGAWRHCARTTARGFENRFETMFTKTHADYDQEILKIYKELCERIKKRTDPLLVQTCSCKGCPAGKAPAKPVYNKQAAANINKWEIFGINARDCKGKTIPPYRTCVGKTPCTNPPDADCLQRVKETEDKPKLEMCLKCKILKIVCDCEDMAGRIVQGPYDSYWERVYDEEADRHYVPPGHLLKDAEHHHCPVDCTELSYLTDSDEDTLDEETIDEEDFDEDANFVQPDCCCQVNEDVGI